MGGPGRIMFMLPPCSICAWEMGGPRATACRIIPAPTSPMLAVLTGASGMAPAADTAIWGRAWKRAMAATAAALRCSCCVQTKCSYSSLLFTSPFIATRAATHIQCQRLQLMTD